MNKKRKFDEKDKKRKNESKSKVDDYGRRVWDKQYYKQKAEEKPEEDENELILKLMPEYKKPKVLPVITEKKLLEGRKEELSLDKNLGKIQTFTLKTPKEQQGGYYCDICDCVLKDSQTYLDHINGKNHNRMLGFSMKVKRVTVDEVKKKLDLLKNKKNKKLVQIKKDPYEEAKKEAQEIEKIEELKKLKRKEKRILKKMEKDANSIIVKENKSEHETDNMSDKENGVGVDTPEKKHEQEQKIHDVSDVESAEVDVYLAMEKMGLPTTFV